MKGKASAFCAVLLLIFFAGCGKENTLVKASGTIEAKEMEISSRISGRIRTIILDEGEFAERGTIIAKVDDRILRAQQEAAEAFYYQALRNLKRYRNLFETNSITEEQLDLAKTQFIKAESDLRQANVMLDEANIYAPWDGVILERNAEVGELLMPNSPVFTFGDLTQVDVTIYIPLIDLGRVKLGKRANVKVDSFKDKVFKGTITRISNEAEFTPKNIQTKDERVKEVFAVKVNVPNPFFELKPGMPADVEIEAEIAKAVPSKIPAR